MADGGECGVFGRTLRRERRARDLTQEELAFQAGIGAKHLSDLERGKKEPRLTTIRRMALALDLTAADLMALWEQQLETG